MELQVRCAGVGELVSSARGAVRALAGKCVEVEPGDVGSLAVSWVDGPCEASVRDVLKPGAEGDVQVHLTLSRNLSPASIAALLISGADEPAVVAALGEVRAGLDALEADSRAGGAGILDPALHARVVEGFRASFRVAAELACELPLSGLDEVSAHLPPRAREVAAIACVLEGVPSDRPAIVGDIGKIFRAIDEGAASARDALIVLE